MQPKDPGICTGKSFQMLHEIISSEIIGVLKYSCHTLKGNIEQKNPPH
jgi:hypothetical protein